MKGYYLEKIKVYCEKDTCEFGKNEVDEKCLCDHHHCCEVIGIPINKYFDEEFERDDNKYPNEIWHTLKDDGQVKIEVSNLQRFKINGVLKWTDNVELLKDVNKFFYPDGGEEIH